MKHSYSRSENGTITIIKGNESSENIEDDHDDKSFTYNLYGPVSKGVTKVEARELRGEMMSVRDENKEILEQLKQMQMSFAKEMKQKNEYEESLMNEIRSLKSRVGDDQTVPFDLESDLRSNIEVETLNNEEHDRGSFAKPLDDYNDNTTENQTVDRRVYRYRRFK